MRTARYLLLVILLSIIGCNQKFENRLKKQTKKLEKIANSLTNKDFGEIALNEIKKIDQNQTLINALTQDFQFCSLRKHSFGISFRFKCENLIKRNPNYSDREYYLIKLTDLTEKDGLGGMEIWADCSAKPEELDKNWFFIRRHLRCD